MIRKIVTYDVDKKVNPSVLVNNTRKVVDFKDKEVADCVQDLNDTLDNLIKVEGNKRGAIGLSATQIGIDLAITAVTLGKNRYILINPSLGKTKGKDRLFRIGCFSLYKYRAMVRYNDDVVINYYDPKGKAKKLLLKGDQSCVVQHEMDHLVGDLLFASLPNKEKDLFVPREALYKDGKVAFNNHGIIFEIEKRIKPRKVMTPPVYYSSLFNDYTDYCRFVDNEVKDKKEFIDIIKKYTPSKGKVLELGPTTSALAINLSINGYKVTHRNIDSDMLDLAISINNQNKSKVKYELGDIDNLQVKTKYNTIFSSEILETLDDDKLSLALSNGLDNCDNYIFLVPTIKIAANTLKGNERLRSVNAWNKYLSNKFNVVECITIDNGGYAMFVISK